MVPRSTVSSRLESVPVSVRDQCVAKKRASPSSDPGTEPAFLLTLGALHML